MKDENVAPLPSMDFEPKANRVMSAVEVEREACAQLVEETDVVTHNPMGYEDNDDGRATLRLAAAAIRARGVTKP